MSEPDDRVALLAGARSQNEILDRRALFLTQEHLENVLRSMDAAALVSDLDGVIESVVGAPVTLSGSVGDAVVGQSIFDIVSFSSPVEGPDPMNALCGTSFEAEIRSSTHGKTPVLVTSSRLTDENGAATGYVLVFADISERKRLEVELHHAQRLESIGQLAAGVAHEINTPIQYIGDSVRFLGDALDDLLALRRSYQRIRELAHDGNEKDEAVRELSNKEQELDVEFIEVEAPKAVARTLQGIERVATIVRALKQFSHPGSDDLAPADLNQIIETALVVAKNEYKYVAEVRLDLADLPQVVCNDGDLGQVILNLIVNAAHAIAERTVEQNGRGQITIRSHETGEGVSVTVADTGGGIPEEIRDRVFEPFFTTKEPGRGTGQGLALAHDIVARKHKGRLTFDVQEGVGTVFELWLPRLGSS